MSFFSSKNFTSFASFLKEVLCHCKPPSPHTSPQSSPHSHHQHTQYSLAKCVFTNSLRHRYLLLKVDTCIGRSSPPTSCRHYRSPRPVAPTRMLRCRNSSSISFSLTSRAGWLAFSMAAWDVLSVTAVSLATGVISVTVAVSLTVDGSSETDSSHSTSTEGVSSG